MALAQELTGAFVPGQASSIGGQYGTLTALGSTQLNAAPVVASLTVVAGADGTKGVVLPGQAGDSLTIFNNSASTLNVYPPVGDTIAVPGTGLGTVNVAFAHLTYKTVTYICLNSSQWLPNVTA